MKLNAPWLRDTEVKTLAKAFEQAKVELRFVGGCVRDTLLEKPFSDMDAATPATPDQVTRLLEAANIQAVPTGVEFGTITAIINHKPFQITTLRKDVATDGRHAEVAYTNAWEEDAARRDFTINALYLGLDGALYDYHGGADDAKAGRVRFIGDAETRIREDYLRILRFFRFNVYYAKTPLDADAIKACESERAVLARLSGERIQVEMLKLLAAPCASDVLSVMEEAGLLEIIGLEPAWVGRVRKIEATSYENDVLIKLAALLDSETSVKPLAERWKLSNDKREQLKIWHHHAAAITPSLLPAEQKKMLRRLGDDNYQGAVLLAYAQGDQPWDIYAPLLEVTGWQAPEFPVSGDDLKAHGISEGKALGDALKRLENIWEESDYTLSKEELLRQLFS